MKFSYLGLTVAIFGYVLLYVIDIYLSFTGQRLSNILFYTILLVFCGGALFFIRLKKNNYLLPLFIIAFTGAYILVVHLQRFIPTRYVEKHYGVDLAFSLSLANPLVGALLGAGVVLLWSGIALVKNR